MAGGGGCCRGAKRVNWMHLDCVERPLSRLLARYALFVARHPWPFIIFPALLAVGLSLGFFHRYEVTDATFLYTPINAPSKYERECVHEKWPLIDGKYIAGKAVTSLRECQSVVTAKDGGNILRSEYAEAISRLNLFIIEKIRVVYDGQTYTYMDLCLRGHESCYTNSQVGLVSVVYNNPDPNWANLTYPMATFGAVRGYLGSSLGGVTVNSSSGLIESAQAWLLLYQLKFSPDNVSYISGLWELEFQRRLLDYADPLLRITVFHSQTLALELKRNAEKLAPRFILCFGILVTFAMLVTLAGIGNRRPYVDWVISKPMLALLGVVGAALGIGSAIGLVSFCGYIYNQIVSVMPFLIISVRLDNTFLMISALRHTSRSLPYQQRVSEAIGEAASAIVVTVATDFFSFLAGVTADIPAVQLFCIYTAVAIFITFLFQLTFFLGLLVLAAKAEEGARNSMITCIRTVTPKEAEERSLLVRWFNQGTRAELHDSSTASDKPLAVAATRKERDLMSNWFEEWYAPVLMHPVMRTLVLIWFVLYLGVAGYLCSQVRQGLEPVKLLVQDSYAIPHYRSFERYYLKNGTEMQLVVNNSPNLALKAERERLKATVQRFATTQHTMGMESVQFWYYDYERYLKSVNLQWFIDDDVEPREFYASVERWMALNTYEKLREDVIWDNVTLNDQLELWMIKSFRMSVGLMNFETALKQIDTVMLMREMAAEPDVRDMNITSFNPLWLFVDQYVRILPNVVQEVVSGMGFMVLIALILIPHPLTSFWVAVTILSVDVGVIGFMTAWSINLDTISMITIIMSIGFSVDFAAHVAHAFVLSSEPGASPVEKVKAAMGEIAWPIIQGGTSTVLGVVVLSDLNSYMVVAFFKTVFLVILLALLHGLVFLPVLLSIFVPRRCGGGSKKNKTGGHSPSSKTRPPIDEFPMDAPVPPVPPPPPALSYYSYPTMGAGSISNNNGNAGYLVYTNNNQSPFDMQTTRFAPVGGAVNPAYQPDDWSERH